MRSKKHMSRLRLARACDIPCGDLVRLERGRHDPDLHVMRQLSFALDETLSTLMLQLANVEYIAELGGERALRRAAAARLSTTSARSSAARSTRPSACCSSSAAGCTSSSPS
jgi:transcriptional regulator with XRE-family HTH domain